MRLLYCLAMLVFIIVWAGGIFLSLTFGGVQDPRPMMFVGFGVLAAIPSAAMLVFASLLRGEIRRINEYLSQAGESTPVCRSRFGLTELLDTFEQAISRHRIKISDMTTKRRSLEVQIRLLEAERRHLEAIFNALSDSVIVTDAFNEIALANDAAARVLRFDLQPAMRKPVDEVISDPALVRMIKDAREAGTESLRRHVEHRRPSAAGQSVYDVTLASVGQKSSTNNGQGTTPGSPASQQRDECAGVVTIMRDVTKEKEIAEMKSDFVSSVSHELRTPLSSIKAYIEMLIDGEAQDEQTQAEFYNIIQSETNRLSRLIDNILNISRIESGMVKIQREFIALPSLVREAVDILQPQARAKRIELNEEPCPLYFQVFADRDMILQALLNLIGNAIKYTPEGGQVDVSCAVDEHAKLASASVRDSGVGISEDDLPHLFEKFYRVQNHKKMAKGTGLGLNLVKHVVETVHGGTVHVKSEPGSGSVFTFDLPIAENG